MAEATGGGGAKESQKKFKFVFVGDQSVGKTSIIKRYMHDDYEESYTVRCRGEDRRR